LYTKTASLTTTAFDDNPLHMNAIGRRSPYLRAGAPTLSGKKRRADAQVIRAGANLGGGQRRV
jgi:hypothetical protein